MHQKFEELIKTKKSKESDWIKTCLTSMSAILGLLISFTEPSPCTLWTNIIFAITITLFGLCILCGLLVLYSDTDIQNRLVQEYIKNTQSLSQPLLIPISVGERKIFLKGKNFFFVLLISSVIFLCVYAVLYKFGL